MRDSATRTFEDFFEVNKRRLTLAVRLVAHDRAQAEDIAQDAFVAVWERWGALAGSANLDAYLFRTAFNLAKNRRRRALLGLKRVVHLVPAGDETDDVVERDVVGRPLRELTRSQRATVVLVDALGYTSVEAGQILGIRDSTVRVHLARGRASLRRTLEDPDESAS
jgi:RNA polymerase sigma factor (sigma-70 family)